MRSYGRFTTTIWRDPDFTSLAQPLQALYFMLATQPDVTAAGTLAITAGRWAKLSDGLTRREVEEQMVALQSHAGRHVILDEDTEELIIRTFIKWDDGWKNSKRLPVIFDAIRAIGSVHIRDIAVDELRKITTGKPHTDAEIAARDAVSRSLNAYLETVRDTPGTSFSPLPVALDLHPKPQPGAVEPPTADAAASPPFNPKRCKDHQTVDIPGNCGNCKDAREAEERRARAELERGAEARKAQAAAILACTVCDEFGRQLSNGVIVSRVCDHGSPAVGAK